MGKVDFKHVQMVKGIQQLLGINGFSVKPDGILGVNTEHAITIFKNRHDLFDEELLTFELMDSLADNASRQLSSLLINSITGNNASMQTFSIEKAIASVAKLKNGVLFSRTKNAPQGITPMKLADAIFKRLNMDIKDTALVMAHFISQLAHESDSFQAVEEYRNRDGSTPRHWLKYEGGADAHGRGLMQLTHDHNYKFYFVHRGYDGTQDYDLLITELEHIIGSALFYWKSVSAWGNINNFASEDDPIMVTMAINGGFNGLKERIELLNKVKAALGLEITTKYYLKNSRLNNSKKFKAQFIRTFGRTVEVQS